MKNEKLRKTYELRLTKESTTSDQKIEKTRDIKYESEKHRYKQGERNTLKFTSSGERRKT